MDRQRHKNFLRSKGTSRNIRGKYSRIDTTQMKKMKKNERRKVQDKTPIQLANVLIFQQFIPIHTINEIIPQLKYVFNYTIS